MNVALSRAMHGLVIIADSDNLKLNEKWNTIFEIFKNDGLVFYSIDKLKEYIVK